MNCKRKIYAWSVIICMLMITLFSFLYNSKVARSNFESLIGIRLKNHFNISIVENIIQIGDAINPNIYMERFSIEEPGIYGELSLSKASENDINKQAKLLLQHGGNSKYKFWVDGLFVKNRDTIDLKVKIHGTSSVHYRSDCKSFKVKSSKPINGLTHFSLIRSDELNPLIALGDYLADSMGVIAPTVNFLKIKIRNEVHYYAQLEDIDERLENNGFEMFRNINQRNRVEYIMTGDPHISRWDLCLPHIKNLHQLSDAGKEKFENLVNDFYSDSLHVNEYFNTHYLGNLFAIAYLFNDIHFMVGHNLRLAFNKQNQKFYPVFRIESSGHDAGVEGYYESRYPYLNTWLFSQHKTRGESKIGELWKTVLSNAEVRFERDMALYQLNKSELVEQIVRYYKAHNWFLVNGLGYGKLQNEVKANQLIRINNLLNKHRNYVSYAKIYQLKEDSLLTILPDALVDLIAVSDTDTIVIPSMFNELMVDKSSFTLPSKTYKFFNKVSGVEVIPEN